MAYGADISETLGNVGNRTLAQGYNKPDEIRKQYTGYEHDDESNLDFAQARYYNASHGRFTSVDPLTASASTNNPQTFNRYTYAMNSPYKFTDPLGLAPGTEKGYVLDGGECNKNRKECVKNKDSELTKQTKEKVPLPPDVKDAVRKPTASYGTINYVNNKSDGTVTVSGSGTFDFSRDTGILDDLETEAAFFYDRAVQELALFNVAVEAIKRVQENCRRCFEVARDTEVGELIIIKDLDLDQDNKRESFAGVKEAREAIKNYNDYVNKTKELWVTRRQTFINNNSKRIIWATINVAVVSSTAPGGVPTRVGRQFKTSLYLKPESLGGLFDERVGAAQKAGYRGY